LEKSNLTARSAQASDTANVQIDDNLPNFWRNYQGRGAGVGRGLGVGEHLPVHGVGGQYRPPLFKPPELPNPPQTIISLPVQTAVWSYRISGASTVLVGTQPSVLGV